MQKSTSWDSCKHAAPAAMCSHPRTWPFCGAQKRSDMQDSWRVQWRLIESRLIWGRDWYLNSTLCKNECRAIVVNMWRQLLCVATQWCGYYGDAIFAGLGLISNKHIHILSNFPIFAVTRVSYRCIWSSKWGFSVVIRVHPCNPPINGLPNVLWKK